MKASFTGHRPNKLPFAYQSNNPFQLWVKEEIAKVLLDLRPEIAISGMALGIDQFAAEVCIELGIPFIAAVPFAGQENAWPEPSRKHFHSLLAKAAEVKIVSEGCYAAWKMQARNQFMVDNSDVVIAVFDGTPGGTKNCYDYAVKQGKKIVRINPSDFQYNK